MYLFDVREVGAIDAGYKGEVVMRNEDLCGDGRGRRGRGSSSVVEQGGDGEECFLDSRESASDLRQIIRYRYGRFWN